MSKLDRMYATARDLIGDSTRHNPEYTRGIVELITHLLDLPSDTGADAVAERLGVEYDLIYPPRPSTPMPTAR